MTEHSMMVPKIAAGFGAILDTPRKAAPITVTVASCATGKHEVDDQTTPAFLAATMPPHLWSQRKRAMRQGSKPQAETPQAARFTRARRAGLPARAPFLLGFTSVAIDGVAPHIRHPRALSQRPKPIIAQVKIDCGKHNLSFL